MLELHMPIVVAIRDNAVMASCNFELSPQLTQR
jgi:hypothetical protein